MSPANSFGKNVAITLIGESHGRCVGVVIDDVPAGYKIDINEINAEMKRRKPGQSSVTTGRQETDEVEILGGLFGGVTTGAPLVLVTWNKDADSTAYEKYKDVLRPGHADLTALLRYGGCHDYRGSGRFSGRLTSGIVMAGAVAKQIVTQANLQQEIAVGAYAREIGGIRFEGDVDLADLHLQVEQNSARCYDQDVASKMISAIEDAMKEKDSVGGIVECIASGIPAGLGDPFFDNVESHISRLLFAIGGVKGIEFGDGFSGVKKRGSEHNDPYFLDGNGNVSIASNHAGGIIGGITTGAPVIIRVAVKPTASIGKAQRTVNVHEGKEVTLNYEGRHDPCIVPRVVPVIEAAVWFTILDFLLGAGYVGKVK